MIQILNYTEAAKAKILSRSMSNSGVEQAVAEIIAEVRRRGDDALRAYSEKFDRVQLDTFEVSEAEKAAARAAVSPELLAVMERAAENIRAYHEKQLRSSYMLTGEDGIVLGQRVIPLKRVGVYVPGGTASYPSTVLMDCIPAKLAGVGELIMVSPATGGAISPVILAAAQLAGVDRIFKLGGAQAIAALAYGTESVPRVDKIVGPGSAYVAEAKKQVFGQVAIDMIAGPSEILVIADGGANAAFVAADLLSQAEHDRMATAILLTDSADLAAAVQRELETQLAALPRAQIARASIDQNGRIILTDSIAQAVELANELAPEHLGLSVDAPFDYLDRIQNAGSVFLGRYSCESLGDYYAGPNHTLPTMGTARFSSPLGVDDFVKKSSFTYYTRPALLRAADDVALFAESEGLHAHARAVTIRKEALQ
ncbi:MAG: histidinol dehydrogenase [Clostridiales bacterium]|nr:histidinol dehydrogenase [Clostridiales bacterium]